MNKVIKFLKSNILGFLVGVLLCINGVIIAETMISSQQVTYSGSKTSETTVNGALDELFESVKINEELVVIKDRLNQIESSYLTVNETYPIGSIYISTRNTNPATIFAGTTWTAFGTGRTLVGVNTSNTNFSTVEKTGGSNTVILNINNLPIHTHSIPPLSGIAASAGDHFHSLNGYYGSTYSTIADGSTYYGSIGGNMHNKTQTTGAHTHTVTTTESITGGSGSGAAFSVQNPYITVYMWKRTA